MAFALARCIATKWAELIESIFMKYPELNPLRQLLLAAAFTALLLGTPQASAEEADSTVVSGPARPTAEALGTAAAAAGFEMTTVRRIFRTYSDCRSRYHLLETCDAKYSRNAWRPESDEYPDGSEVCGNNGNVLRRDDTRGDVSRWKHLFRNERCHNLGYSHVTVRGKHDPEYVKFFSQFEEDARFLRCMDDYGLRLCLKDLGRAAWRPERFDDPSGAGTCTLNGDILELIYARGRPLPYRRLFFNERCQRLALPDFAGTSKDPIAHYRFTDLTWGFSIDYPADWDVIQSGTGEIRLKVASPDGFVCGVIVREAPKTRGNYNPGHLFDEDRELKNPAREKFKRAYETIMKRRLPDFEIGGQPGLELTAYPGIMVVADILDFRDARF